jgi:hypothetical protein
MFVVSDSPSILSSAQSARFDHKITLLSHYAISTMPSSSVAPIIKNGRVPLGLQAVFLASARGDLVNTPPTIRRRIGVKLSRSQLSSFNDSGSLDGSTSPRLLFAGCHTLEFDASKPVLKCKVKRRSKRVALDSHHNIVRSSSGDSAHRIVRSYSSDSSGELLVRSYSGENRRIISERGASRWEAEPTRLHHAVGAQNASLPCRRGSLYL